MKLSQIFLLILLPAFWSCNQENRAHSNDSNHYYVSPEGSDDHTGGIGDPWKTITFGQSQLQAGDTLYVRSGRYIEAVHISNSGVRDNPIVISAYPGELPVIDGDSLYPDEDWGSLVTLSGSYIHMSGFEVMNSNITRKVKGGEGVMIKGGVYNKLSFMKIHHIGDHGIDVNADYATVEDCEVFLCAMNNKEHVIPSGWANGISFAREKSNGITEHGIIRRCRVYNVHGEGIDAYEANEVTIEDCLVYDNWTMNLYVADATNCLVQRNIVYNSPQSTFPVRNNYRSGITLADEISNGESIPHSSGNVVINNFLYNADLSGFGWTLVPHTGLDNVLIAHNTIVNGSLSIGGTPEDGIVHNNSRIINNIVDGRVRVADHKGLTFSNNNWTVSPPVNAAGKGDIIGDPLLARTGNTNPGFLTGDFFMLSSGSPCIDKGLPLGEVTQDFFKKERTHSPDIGGHEYRP